MNRVGHFPTIHIPKRKSVSYITLSIDVQHDNFEPSKLLETFLQFDYKFLHRDPTKNTEDKT